MQVQKTTPETRKIVITLSSYEAKELMQLLDKVPLESHTNLPTLLSHLQQILHCRNDSDHDGDCRLCVKNGCFSIGGPF